MMCILFSGHKCPTAALSEPIECPDGDYQNDTAQTDCLPCLEGHECSDPAADPQECSTGYYSSAGATSCTACDTGKMS